VEPQVWLPVICDGTEIEGGSDRPSGWASGWWTSMPCTCEPVHAGLWTTIKPLRP